MPQTEEELLAFLEQLGNHADDPNALAEVSTLVAELPFLSASVSRMVCATLPRFLRSLPTNAATWIEKAAQLGGKDAVLILALGLARLRNEGEIDGSSPGYKQVARILKEVLADSQAQDEERVRLHYDAPKAAVGLLGVDSPVSLQRYEPIRPVGVLSVFVAGVALTLVAFATTWALAAK